MNKKGDLGAGVWLILGVLIAGVILYFYLGGAIPWIKESAVSSRCGISVSSASLTTSEGLPRLDCDKIPIEIKGENKEEIKKELSDLFIDMSSTFGVRKTFSKVTETYCRRRYHPITFKKKGLAIDNFGSYLKSNVPSKFLDSFSFVPGQINTNREYTLLFVVVYKSEWETFMEKGIKNLRLTELGVYDFESRYLGFALVESDKILSTLECDHLV